MELYRDVLVRRVREKYSSDVYNLECLNKAMSFISNYFRDICDEIRDVMVVVPDVRLRDSKEEIEFAIGKSSLKFTMGKHHVGVFFGKEEIDKIVPATNHTCITYSNGEEVDMKAMDRYLMLAFKEELEL
ncbi:hypothetical protein GCM10025857_34100 [Alicyclobacillus contaminans]|nr:hypothetical protein GCM10025857_34100 [Alicyclobacillus contaminans]